MPASIEHPTDGLHVVSLCAGIGGIDLAFHRAGIPARAAVEIDPFARGVLADRFPETVLFDDLTKVTADDLTAAGVVPNRTVLTAGWPCKGNSVAGRRGGLGDAQSGLWVHVARLLAELRPRWFVGENVPGLLSVNHGRDFAVIAGDLAELGMEFCWRVLDASYFGVPQRRRRLVLAGHLGELRGAPAQVLLEPASSLRDPAPSRPPAPDPARTVSGSAGTSRSEHDTGLSYVAEQASTLQAAGDGRGDRLDAEMAAGGQLIVYSDGTVRRLTPMECERLQGLPDGWTAISNDRRQADSHRFRQLGNSVAVPVFEWLANRIAATDTAGTAVTLTMGAAA
ncbi:DNA cytosine methyltransferase [Kribbella soli]|uniref:DNA (cytosine-5-)-methyltransferase n=1 Tax=Kribbella soli TaxID=1124743 RepID=A0A4R0HHX0_9ACTN|nr:DNA (cytosine-5-)-methyltransferase [Kribbella soli]TCC10907.1 DNA (cytosine-5-)-methyltransferase [Kribbella soli]